ncbi:MAG: hypothetical protein ACK4K7_05415 [Allosphingosinicella sp.]|uniref:hypothetical protein n=1 Tax=Allosphingosinicella sp. TaxID=2823234 RepID=UPI00396175CD
MDWKAVAVAFAPAALLLAGCGDSSAPDGGGAQGSTTPRYERPQESRSVLGETEVPVRIGELGPSFAACNTHGRTRNLSAGETLPVRAAPYDEAQERSRLSPDAEFFICSRSHDQRWLGIVYAEGGTASPACGVSAPVTARRDYEGPCESGWVSSAFVRLVSGINRPAAAEQMPTN